MYWTIEHPVNPQPSFVDQLKITLTPKTSYIHQLEKLIIQTCLLSLLN
ncbi:hypothetical protein [Basilea psittacipulmonis]|nr:hypothetical protein [Basilea psittacipulmonis]